MSERLSAFTSSEDLVLTIVLAAATVLVFGGVWYLISQVPRASTGFWIIMTVITIATLWVVGTLPFSYNQLSKEGITLRQGLYFRAFIPYTNIKSAEVSSIPPGVWMPGVRRGEGGKELRVVLGRKNLIRLELKSPQRFVLFGFIPFVQARSILFNAPAPEETVRLIVNKVQ